MLLFNISKGTFRIFVQPNPDRTQFLAELLLQLEGEKHILKEIFIYFIRRKKFWLIPVFIVLLLVAFLFLITEGTVVAPFVYTVF